MVDAFDDAISELRSYSGPDAELTAPILEIVRVTGASVSTMGFLPAETIAASDRRAARLDEAQFDLGEGPCWDAVASGLPTYEPDLRRTPPRWPALVDALSSEAIGAVYAFPMSVGALRMGALDLYHSDPHELEVIDRRRAGTIAEALGRHVLRRALSQMGDEEPPVETSPFSRRLVHQATGYVVGQLGVSVDEAALLIQGQAFATGRSMREVAVSILGGSQRFVARGDMIEDDR
jgi:hypothetical protein